jgi:hypothetical protein
MKETKFYCLIDKVTMTRNIKMTGGIWIDGKIADIPAHDVASFRCNFGGSPNRNLFGLEPGAILTAHLHAEVKYKTLIFDRTSDRIEFTWFTDANPPRWIKGKIVK